MEKIKLPETHENEMIDITKQVQQIVSKSKTKEGIVTVFVSGSTGALTTIEYEPGLLEDFPKMLERIAPTNMAYKHVLQWHDGNGHSHVKASLLGPSITIPFENGKLCLGEWQQIIFIELDIKPRHREIIIQITKSI